MNKAAQEYFDIGDRQMEAADRFLNDPDPEFTEYHAPEIAFWAAQATEVYLKGYFVQHLKHHGKTHDLVGLNKEIMLFSTNFPDFREELEPMAEILTARSRYPTNDTIFLPDAKRIFQSALKIKDVILSLIKAESERK